jgi:hypothetical protein
MRLGERIGPLPNHHRKIGPVAKDLGISQKPQRPRRAMDPSHQEIGLQRGIDPRRQDDPCLRISLRTSRLRRSQR